MGLFKGIKQAVANATSGAPPDLSTLTPEQRANYERNMAEVERNRALGEASWAESNQIAAAARASQVLQGPAGVALHGEQRASPSPAELEAQLQQQGMGGFLRAALAQSGREFAAAARQSFSPGVSGPPEIEDPAERARVAAAERAARDAARVPYRAPEVPAVAFSRVATRGSSQIEQVLAHLAASGLASRPDLVYGVYRVPDRISPALSSSSERKRVVEWDIVHWPASLPPAEVAVRAAYLPADEHWVARRAGEPEVLDEDIAALYCSRTGVTPERCFGMARAIDIVSDRYSQDESSSPLFPRIRGIHVLHWATPGDAEAAAQLAAQAPIALPPTTMPGAHMEVLEWEEVARVVHPRAQRAAPVPSAFPYLPSTPQELLVAYLEVVGVRPSDCWSAQVTITRPVELIGSIGMGTTNVGPKLPCADGTPRMRLHGAQKVVLVYRDRPEYVTGRERWASYQHHVLQARLDMASGQRPAIWADDPNAIGNAALRAGAKFLGAIDRLSEHADTPNPYRYCWPLVR